MSDNSNSASGRTVPAKHAFLTGVALLLASAGMFMIPQITDQTSTLLPIFVACAGLAAILYSAGGEGSATAFGFKLGGAAAIAVALFTIFLYQKRQDEAASYQGMVLIRASTPILLAKMAEDDPHFVPQSVNIAFGGDSVNGRLRKVAPYYVADFTLNEKKRVKLGHQQCISLYLKFGEGPPFSRYFERSDLLSDKSDALFQFEIMVDKGTLYYSERNTPKMLMDCNTSAKNLGDAEKNTTRKPSGPPAGPVETVKPATESNAGTTPIATATKLTEKVIGYVVFSQLSTDFKSVTKSFFDISGKPSARFPVPNDMVVALSSRSMFAEPFHWDGAQQKHVVPKVLMKLPAGTKAKVAGDAIIAHDETNQAQYVISAITEIIGQNIQKTQDIYPPTVLPEGVIGYAYLGYLNVDGSAYVDKTFNNYSKPDALYPGPGDLLVATANVWLRAGPRRWDASRQDYVNAAPLTPIVAGQYARIGGDTLLAKGGLSVWAPISKIYAGGLAEVAAKP